MWRLIFGQDSLRDIRTKNPGVQAQILHKLEHLGNHGPTAALRTLPCSSTTSSRAHLAPLCVETLPLCRIASSRLRGDTAELQRSAFLYLVYFVAVEPTTGTQCLYLWAAVPGGGGRGNCSRPPNMTRLERCKETASAYLATQFSEAFLRDCLKREVVGETSVRPLNFGAKWAEEFWQVDHAAAVLVGGPLGGAPEGGGDPGEGAYVVRINMFTWNGTRGAEGVIEFSTSRKRGRHSEFRFHGRLVPMIILITT